MTIALHTYRQTLLRAVLAIRAGKPIAHIHLIYTPELQDPLNLVTDTRRETALVHAPTHSKFILPFKENAPRLLTLDCRRVAPYLLETDPALDDPAFEHSITQSHAETCLAQSHDRELNNDEREFSDRAVGGWLVGTESARTLAARLYNFPSDRRSLVRWTHPSVLGTLWPTMTSEQRFLLLGDATWLIFDDNSVLQQFAITPGPEVASATMRSTAISLTRKLSAHQLQRLQNVTLVRNLHEKWKAMWDESAKKLPAHAEERLHALVSDAQQAGLDAESVAVYAMTAVQLESSAMVDGEWTRLVSHAGQNGMALCDLLATLSVSFWNRYRLSEHEGRTEFSLAT